MNGAPILFLLSVLLGASCASSGSRTQGPGYDLAVHQGEVSLSLNRALSMPEFLALAQQVTGNIYTYRAQDLAELAPVTLAGEIRCERAEFSDFVQTMLYVHGLRLQPTTAGDRVVQEVLPIQSGEADPLLPDDEVSFSSDRPLPVAEFLEIAERLTKNFYTYRATDLAGVGPIALQGKIRCARSDFGQFVQTMLYTKGLCLAASPSTEGTYRVVPIDARRG
jgi:hypothetical protein